MPQEVALRWDWNSLLTGSVGTELPFRNFSKRFYPLRSEMANYLDTFRTQQQVRHRLLRSRTHFFVIRL